MKLSDIATALEGYAEKAWVKVEEEAIEIFQTVEPVIESAFAQAVQQFGDLAVSTVISLFGAAGNALSGSEKLNLTATTIVQAAADKGVKLLEADVTALAKAAYTAVISAAPAAQAQPAAQAASQDAG